jgi:hypothetical protein
MTITGPDRGIGRWEFDNLHTGPVVMLLPDGVNVMVVETFAYVDPDGHRWTVPYGTISDGATIPQLLWSDVGSPLTGKYRAAAILHDFLYRAQAASKDVADRVLMDAMRCSGVDEQLCRTIYEAVHVGGGSAYAEDGKLLDHPGIAPV